MRSAQGGLGSADSFGLDVVGPAAFLALLWPRLRDGRTERTVALAGAVIALAATPFCPPGLPVVLAATAALSAALLPGGAAGTGAAGDFPAGAAEGTNRGAGDMASGASCAGPLLAGGPDEAPRAASERPCR